ncbi:MAG: PilZ domain-containing protein [Armatimonadetes bacterium]|nr:PilZ domain-containing protein [Armatimonadota bacterium]
MEFFKKIKSALTGEKAQDAGGFQTAERRNARLPSTIKALCSTDGAAAFSVTIDDLGLTGVRIESPRRLETDKIVDFRVPVSMNFENRDTQMYVAFKGRVMWTRKGAGGHEAGIRYEGEPSPLHDQWIAKVLALYGFEVIDDNSPRRGELRCKADIPLEVRLSDGQSLRGNVINISMGGLLAVVNGQDLAADLPLDLHVGAPGDMAVLRLKGHVVRTRAEHTEGSWLLATAFDEVTDEQRKKLAHLLSLLSRQT